jgi:glycosyltransferase involved in cell wall biosynthesis
MYDDFPVRAVEQKVKGKDRIELIRDAPIAEVRKTLQSAAIAVVPSIMADPFPLAAVEAHFTGTALISSGSGGLRELSGPGAAYLDAVTPQAIADTLRGLMCDPEKRLALARKGQQYVLEHHTAKKAAQRLDAIRDRIVADRAKRS